MLSIITHDFLKKIIKSSSDISKVIDRYLYSERYVIAIDFELIYIKMLTGIKADVDVNDLKMEQFITLNFFNRLLAGDALDTIIADYDFSKRELLASVVYRIQRKLLKK